MPNHLKHKHLVYVVRYKKKNTLGSQLLQEVLHSTNEEDVRVISSSFPNNFK